jgi:flagellar export protein FliJ
MADVLKHLQKLREHEKKQAQLDLAKAQRAEDAQRGKIEANAQKVRDAQENTQENDAAEVARYHAFRLRMEMIRRRESGRLQKRQNQVMVAREVLNHSVRQVRTLDHLIENREKEEAKEARKVDNELMNELSVQAWWRNTG